MVAMLQDVRRCRDLDRRRRPAASLGAAGAAAPRVRKTSNLVPQADISWNAGALPAIASGRRRGGARSGAGGSRCPGALHLGRPALRDAARDLGLREPGGPARLQLCARPGDRGVDGGLPALGAGRARNPDGDLQPPRGPLPPEQSASGEARADPEPALRRGDVPESLPARARQHRRDGVAALHQRARRVHDPLLLLPDALRRRARPARQPPAGRRAAPLHPDRPHRSRLQPPAAGFVSLRDHRGGRSAIDIDNEHDYDVAKLRYAEWSKLQVGRAEQVYGAPALGPGDPESFAP